MIRLIRPHPLQFQSALFWIKHNASFTALAKDKFEAFAIPAECGSFSFSTNVVFFSQVNYSEERLICRIRPKWIRRWERLIKVFSPSNYASRFLIHTLLSATVFKHQPLCWAAPTQPALNLPPVWMWQKWVKCKHKRGDAFVVTNTSFFPGAERKCNKSPTHFAGCWRIADVVVRGKWRVAFNSEPRAN